jgi:hypothetical protein
MTALKEYQRLECSGLWREADGAQRREVIVAFGDATLVISDARNTRALAHWSLPAILRLNPTDQPARYAPGPDAGEELEIEDDTMIAAIAKVHALIEARRPHPGRLRAILLGTALAAVIAVGLFWVPRALITHTAAALPSSKRQEIGHMALADLERLTGIRCAGPEGSTALARLRDRLLGPNGQIVVLPDGLNRTGHLPGGIVLLPRMLVEAGKSPDVIAGAVLAEDQRRRISAPTEVMLRHAGLRATLTLLTTGDLPDTAVAGYGEVILDQPQSQLTDTDLIARFASAGLSTTPYAYALDPTGETVLGLIEADPMRNRPAEPVLSDTEWVALQGICTG